MEIGQGRRVAMTGAGGFLGTAFRRLLEADGVEVIKLVRRKAGPGEVSWDPLGDWIDAEGLEGLDAVIHLAGENIAGVWTHSKRRRIMESRARGTGLLARTLADLERPPGALISASGVNYYGDSGEARLTEKSPPGDDFLARVCMAWENATTAASIAGIRVVNLRFAPVLDRSGGVLKVMLMPFRMGLGARMGGGQQWFSWIALGDALRTVRHALESDDLEGPVNAAAPEPIRNADLTRALGRAVRRPSFLVVPGFAINAVTGGMANALLLASMRVVPEVLLRRGFSFEIPSFERLVARGLDGGG